MRIILKVIKLLFQVFNVLVIGILLSIHFIFKEYNYEASMYFYLFPLPLIIVIVVFLSIFIGKKMRKLNLVLAAALLALWLGRSFKIHIPEKINTHDLEIVFWNASRDNNFEMALNESQSFPDIMVLVESKKIDISVLKSKFPEYYYYKSAREISVFSKSPLEIISEETSKFNTTVVSFKTKNIHFYAIDVTGSTDVPRVWELNFVNKLIEQKNNTIILGDFNVPFESKYLNPIKKEFNHAFNKKGNGFRETWFWNVPFLSLDHIWVSKDLEILKTKKINTFKSDHSMLKTYIKR